jgi:hypothetical protein
VGPRAGLDRCGKSPPTGIRSPDGPARSSVAILTELPGPQHGHHSFKFVICIVLLVIRVVLLLIVMFYVLFMCKCVLPPGVIPIAVDKYININLDSRS